MEISQKQIDELKVIMKKNHDVEYTDEQAREAAYNLMGLAELCFKQWQTEQRWKRKLEENPKGFPLEDSGRSCCICKVGTSPENSWYDKYGIKCLNCQRALDKRIIPVSITNDWGHKTWFSIFDLQHELGLKTAAINKHMREGALVARTIENKEGGVYFQVFLNKENVRWRKNTSLGTETNSSCS